MKELNPNIKLSYISGLRDVVVDEINTHADFHILEEDGDSVYLEYVQDINTVKALRSVTRAYVVVQDAQCNPYHLSNHKSIVGDLVEMVIVDDKAEFRSFKITCAGSDSPEVRAIAEYIQGTYRMTEKEEADLKIHIIKVTETMWEAGIQITPRPLSVREYKVRNMSGAMDPTIAYAVNSLCRLDTAKTYLNIFSGSGTLLIEAGQQYPNLEQLIGFDNNKEHLSLSVQNIKKAGLIKKIKLKEADIFDTLELGTFDAITSDLPFGMSIAKNDDLEKLYGAFIDHCEEALNPDGRLVVYTNEYELFENLISKSRFKILDTLGLKFITSVNAYLYPKIFVCAFK